MSNLNAEQQVYLAITYRNTNVSAVARALGMTQQNLNRKLTRNTLKKEELGKIAKILGGEYVSYFSFPGDVVIGGMKEGKIRK